MVLNINIEEGDYLSGRWREPATGMTYEHEGTVRQYPAGLFVQYEDEGITNLELFYEIHLFIKKHKTSEMRDIMYGKGVTKILRDFTKPH